MDDRAQAMGEQLVELVRTHPQVRLFGRMTATALGPALQNLGKGVFRKVQEGISSLPTPPEQQYQDVIANKVGEAIGKKIVENVIVPECADLDDPSQLATRLEAINELLLSLSEDELTQLTKKPITTVVEHLNKQNEEAALEEAARKAKLDEEKRAKKALEAAMKAAAQQATAAQKNKTSSSSSWGGKGSSWGGKFSQGAYLDTADFIATRIVAHDPEELYVGADGTLKESLKANGKLSAVNDFEQAAAYMFRKHAVFARRLDDVNVLVIAPTAENPLEDILGDLLGKTGFIHTVSPAWYQGLYEKTTMDPHGAPFIQVQKLDPKTHEPKTYPDTSMGPREWVSIATDKSLHEQRFSNIDLLRNGLQIFVVDPKAVKARMGKQSMPAGKSPYVDEKTWADLAEAADKPALLFKLCQEGALKWVNTDAQFGSHAIPDTMLKAFGITPVSLAELSVKKPVQKKRRAPKPKAPKEG